MKPKFKAAVGFKGWIRNSSVKVCEALRDRFDPAAGLGIEGIRASSIATAILGAIAL